MTLKDIEIGASARVLGVKGGDRIAQRLMEMGIVPGTDITVIKSAPFGDPIEVRLMGYNLAIRRAEAAAIEVDIQGGTAF